MNSPLSKTFFMNLRYDLTFTIKSSVMPELNISMYPSSHGHGNGHMNGNRFISANRVSYSDIKWS